MSTEGRIQITETTSGDRAFAVQTQERFISTWWTPGIVADAASATRLVERVDQLQVHRTLPILVHLNGMKSLSRCAMQILARELNVPAAALVGPSAVDRTITDFFIQVHAPVYPVGHFINSTSAQEWLGVGKRGA
jgi:hypothetical protein